MGRAAWTWVAPGILFSVAIGIALLSVDFLPTNDGPQQIFGTFASLHIDDAALGYSRYLERGSPISNYGFDVIYRPLLHVLDWRLAHQVALTVIALTWAWGVMTLAVVLGRPLLGLFGFATAFQWSLYMGFYPFLFVSGIGMFVVAYACRPAPRPVVLAGLLLCQAFFHVFAAALTGTVVATVWLSRAEPGRRLVELGKCALIGLPALALALAVSLSAHSFRAPTLPGPGVLGRLRLLADAFTSGPFYRAWPPVITAGCALGWSLLRLLGKGNPLSRIERGLFWAALLFLVGAIALPLHVSSWEFLCVRFSPYAITLLCLLVPVETFRSRALIGALQIALLAYAAFSIGWAASYHHELRRAHDDVLFGVEAPLKRTGARLDLILNISPEGERALPLSSSAFHIGALFAITQGGTPTGIWQGLPTVHFLRRPERLGGPDLPMPGVRHKRFLQELPKWNPPALRVAALNDALSYSPGYDDVIVYGFPEDLAVLEARRFRFDFRRGGLAIGQFQWCPVAVEVEPADTPVFVESSWRPKQEMTPVATLSPPQHSLTIAQSPCGEFWLRILYDTDRNGKPSPGDTGCKGAGPGGLIRLELKEGGNRLECQRP